MDDECDGALPNFPGSPEGIPRMEHPPTVEASIRYWEAVRVYAIRVTDSALARTALGLRSEYEDAWRELTKSVSPRQVTAKSTSRRGRLSP